jgi:hypothetical protein
MGSTPIIDHSLTLVQPAHDLVMIFMITLIFHENKHDRSADGYNFANPLQDQKLNPILCTSQLRLQVAIKQPQL